MGKSSSSLQKKRSKDSSQLRKKKKTRVKSKRYKSKAAHRHSSDDDSTSSVSFSSSSSEDYSRSRKRSRSRTRKDLKSSSKRKREKRHDSSSESSSDDDYSRKRKRKKSKKNNDLKVKKRDYVKKKKKKAYSASSSSSDGESEHVRVKARGRSKRKEKEKKQYRSKSCSSCSEYSEENRDYPIEEKMTVEKPICTTRRLKSVITIPDGVMYGSGIYDAGYKDEMVYDRDDYPSSRSNDSNGVENNPDFSPPSNVNAEEPIGDNKGEALVSEECEKVDDDLGRNLVETDDVVKESILRQKALENFKKFRGKVEKAPSIQKDEISSPVKQPSTLRKLTLPKEENISISNESNRLPQNDEKLSDRKDTQDNSASIKGVPVIRNAKKNINVNISSIPNKPNLASPLFNRALSNIRTSTLPILSPRAKLANQVTHDSFDEMTADIVTPQSGSSGESKNVSASVSVSVETSSSPKPTPEDESKDGSQFEEKKMTVMRGGEMVEVNYKVYIPKKTPALHRRQLNR